MPAFKYTCSNCRNSEIRIAGINDRTVHCDKCDHVMERHVDVDNALASYGRKYRKAQ